MEATKPAQPATPAKGAPAQAAPNTSTPTQQQPAAPSATNTPQANGTFNAATPTQATQLDSPSCRPRHPNPFFPAKPEPNGTRTTAARFPKSKAKPKLNILKHNRSSNPDAAQEPGSKPSAAPSNPTSPVVVVVVLVEPASPCPAEGDEARTTTAANTKVSKVSKVISGNVLLLWRRPRRRVQGAGNFRRAHAHRTRFSGSPIGSQSSSCLPPGGCCSARNANKRSSKRPVTYAPPGSLESCASVLRSRT